MYLQQDYIHQILKICFPRCPCFAANSQVESGFGTKELSQLGNDSLSLITIQFYKFDIDKLFLVRDLSLKTRVQEKIFPVDPELLCEEWHSI